MLLENFFSHKRYWWVRHTLFWLVVYADGFFEIIYYFEDTQEIWELAYSLVIDMLLVYVNIYILIPKFLVEKKDTAYLSLTFISVILVILANYASIFIMWGPENLEDLDTPSTLLTTGFYTIGTLGIAAAIKITKYFYERQQHLSELRQSQLKSEVNYLKQQTNPHFLFNTLNSIYVLAKQKKENTPNAIMLLSDLMRYQTYDASNEKVPLTKEIEFLENYLELEKLRRDKLVVDFYIEGNISGELIEPLIFLPFIENAVKHSATTDESNEQISISFINRTHDLKLMVNNTVGKNTLNSIQRENSGFGLENVKKRINLLYPDRHLLNISESEAKYQIEFIINK